MSQINYIIDYISKRNAIHTKKLRKTLPKLGEEFERRAALFFQKYEALLAGQGKNLDFSIDCYLKLVADITLETKRFMQTGEYSSKSFAEVNQRVYGNPEVMEYYLHGLLLSQFLWKHHYEMFCFFTEQLTKRRHGVKHYLEIGGGHGLQVSEAVRLLSPDATFTVVDISSTSLATARWFIDNPRVQFVLSDVLEYETDKKFDYITIGEVIEHLEDPGALLRGLRNFLADDGTLFLTTPANGPTIDHIYLFRNAEEIRVLLRDSGYVIEDEILLYAEDVPRETADENKITLLYGACLKKSKA